MPFPAAERRRQERVEDVLALRQREYPASQAHHVRVVVLAREPRHLHRRTHGRPDPVVPVRRDAHADPRAAHQQSNVRRARQQRRAHLVRKIRVIDRRRAVRAAIDRDVSERLDVRRQRRFQGVRASYPAWSLPIAMRMLTVSRENPIVLASFGHEQIPAYRRNTDNPYFCKTARRSITTAGSGCSRCSRSLLSPPDASSAWAGSLNRYRSVHRYAP